MNKHLIKLKKVLTSTSDTLTFCVIGGSITEGASATEISERYANRIASHLQKMNINKKINFINKGIGATGSNTGVFRLKQDIIDNKPDLLIVEFSVNDTFHEDVDQTLEGIYRQMQESAPNCAIIQLCTIYQDFKSAEDKHRKVADHYEIPVVSIREIIKNKINNKEMNWHDYAVDNVHPTTLGHKMLSDLVTNLIDETYKNKSIDITVDTIKKIPPLITTKYEFTKLIHADNLVATIKKGWWSCNNWYFRERLESDTPGSVLEFDLKCDSLFLIYKKFPGDFGKIKITIDNKHEKIVDAYFDQRWGGYSCFETISKDLPLTNHKIRIELLNDKNKNSFGNRFQIEGICITTQSEK